VPALSVREFFLLSVYWFATAFKWTLVLFILLPARVAELVPDAEKASRLGLLFGVGAVMATLGPPLFGYLSDRFPSRRGRRLPYLKAGALLTALALWLMAYAPSYGVLVAGYLLLQLADDLATGPYAALIPDLVPPAQRGAASGWMGAMQAGAQVVAGLVGFLVNSLTLLFGLAALLNLAAAGLTLRFVQEPENPTPRREGLLESLLLPWRDPDFRWVFGTRFLVMLGQYLVQTYLQYYLHDVVRSFTLFGRAVARHAYQAVGLLVLLISASGALVSVPAGRFSDRFGRKPLIYASGVALSLLLFPVLLVPRYDLLVALSLLFGVGYGVYAAVDWALATDVMKRREAHGTEMGVWQTSFVLPQILAGLAGRGVDGLNRIAFPLGYQVVFSLAALAFLAGTLLVSRVRGVR